MSDLRTTCSGIFPGVMVVVLAVASATGQESAAPVATKPPLEASVPEDSPRLTDQVRLVQKAMPATVAIRAFRNGKEKNQVDVGSGCGSVIHPAGYVLTNSHVVSNANRGEVAFFNKPWQEYEVMFNFPSEDLAILKIDSEDSLPTLIMGRSHDLMLGEPVMAIGNPEGLVHSVSFGVVSGINRATNTEHAHLPSMVQTTAAISGGSSGGPLVNALGEQIGVVTSRKEQAENVGFAILVDRIREMLPELIAAEKRYGFRLGVEIEPLTTDPIVNQVVADSPAADAGLKKGDVITHVGEMEIRSAVDFQLALVDAKAGDMLVLRWLRDGEPISGEVTLQPLAAPAPMVISEDNLTAGIRWKVYRGSWKKLPNFDNLEAEATGTGKHLALDVVSEPQDEFGYVADGMLRIPKTGFYIFYLGSDDGSRLMVANQPLIDNDGVHAKTIRQGSIRLEAGLYPFRVEYFDVGGDHVLNLMVDGPGIQRRKIPTQWFVRRSDEAVVDSPSP